MQYLMEMNEDHPNEKSKDCLSGLAIARDQPRHSHFGRDEKAGRGVGQLYNGKREGFRCAQVGGRGKLHTG